MSQRFLISMATAVLLWPCGCKPESADAPDRRGFAVTDVLQGGPIEGFARARKPREFSFPDDHGAHPEFRSEWWYFTGNLATTEGRRFGYHLTFFRSALRPPEEAVVGVSAWRTDQVWMAHFALTDVDGERVHSDERFARGALDLAGAAVRPFRVWVDDWSASSEAGDGAILPLRLRASGDESSVDLELRPGKPIVLQGDRGLSRKSEAPGNASYYYSFTRVPVSGTVWVGGAPFAVEGLGWIDREWSTSALGAGQVGWDWFSIQLDDGRELMWYRLRRSDGTADPASAGTLVAAGGGSIRLSPEDVVLESFAHWASPRGDARYPVSWRLRVPREGIDLMLEPRLQDSELDLSVRYWEGAIAVSGSSSGSGYLEMTGY